LKLNIPEKTFVLELHKIKILSMKLKYILKEISNFKGEMILLKNMEKAGKFGSKYGQDVEPAGFYALQYIKGQSDVFLKNPNYKLFTVDIKNPLIINVNDDNLIEWKRELSNEYNAKGKSLTTKLLNKGYDAIITKYDAGDTGEIIILDTKKIKEYV
jgi:hypothetical protein